MRHYRKQIKQNITSMAHIFQFHKGDNLKIQDWGDSKRIEPKDLTKVGDKTIDISSSIGTSIPTPIARLFLFDTAFQIVAKQIEKKKVDPNNVFCGLVSEVLDLLELLYMHGANNKRLEFKDWTFSSFGDRPGHKLLNESFAQAIKHAPFNGSLSITLIYYKEEMKHPVLIGGTSPYTFVFTAPNFKENLKKNGCSDINGLITGDKLFDNEYKGLNERDAGFIQYVNELSKLGEEQSEYFESIDKYVEETRKAFNIIFTQPSNIKDIKYGESGVLMVSNVNLKHRSEADYKQTINKNSDFRMQLPDDSEFIIQEIERVKIENPKLENESDNDYNRRLRELVHAPLFLLNKMPYQGNYTSSTKKWSSSTRVLDGYGNYPAIESIKDRELPDDGNKYPFFSDFDFFERCLVKLPGYKLNDEKFLCITEDQDFLLPLKPLFFHLFPADTIKKYVTVNSKDGKVTVALKITVYGNGTPRDISCSKTYDYTNTIVYSGILGIFPFIKSDKKYLNKYTVAAFEKIGTPLSIAGIDFYKEDATKRVISMPKPRNKYTGYDGAINTQSTYYLLENEFSFIHLKFKPDNSECGGMIIPKFKKVENGYKDYVYAIDFGTSNTHIEFSVIDENKKVSAIKPFEVNEKNMLMTLLNKPMLVEDKNNNTIKYNDYGLGLGVVIESANQLTLREFMPFQFGRHNGATFKFPFRTASYEKSKTIKDSNPVLFVDSNIGFNIDKDLNNLSDLYLTGNNYQTNLKWLLESQKDSLNENRVSLFIRQLLLMIRTHAHLQEQPANIDSLKIAFSYPISMGNWDDNPLKNPLKNEFKNVFGIYNENKETEKEEEEFSKRLIILTESIAPYYCLLDQDANIGHDVYCNIDIGGGTSDIVLVEKEQDKVLKAYCSSIKFAGKQLWGSGAGKDTNPESNGFIRYYKKYLSREPNLYEEVKKILEGDSGSVKTDDIISYLFSDEKLKFKAIFTECKELRVPLLLHYSAILYFITKTCKVKEIALPKTISFSGKGSEYISLLFPDKDNLEDFTYRALEIFSGLSVNKEFKTKSSKEPKVITAKGAVSYAANPRKLKKRRIKRDGDEGESKELAIEYIDIYHYGSDDKTFETGAKKYVDFKEGGEGFKKVLECNKEFLEALFDKDAGFVKEIEKWLKISNLKQFKDYFIQQETDLYSNGILRASFLNVLKTHKMEKDAQDSPFFFAFSESLIELSKRIADAPK